jgi:hypothetical protein
MTLPPSPRLPYLCYLWITKRLQTFAPSIGTDHSALAGIFLVHPHGPTDVVMRMVARQAANSRFVMVITFAVGKAVRLKANVLKAWMRVSGNFRPCSVTLAAKVGGFFRGKSIQLCQLLGLTPFITVLQHIHEVRVHRTMTALALHAGGHIAQGKLFAVRRPCCMTPKTANLFIRTDLLRSCRQASNLAIPSVGPKPFNLLK